MKNGRRVNPGQRHRKRGGMIFESSLELCLVSPSAVMLRRELFDRLAVLGAETLRRLGSCYKTQLYEAGLLESNRANSTRKILKPILDIAFEHWLYDHDLGIMVKTLTGVR